MLETSRLETSGQQSVVTHLGTQSTVSLNMLIDFLHHQNVYHVLSCPETTQREFTSVIPVSKRDPQLFYEVADETQALFVCHSDNAEKVLEEHTALFVLALARTRDVPLWVEQYADRVLLIQGQENFSYFSFLLQKYFMEIMVWENDMDHIVLSKGTLKELLNAASYLTDNFFSVNDSHFNLIAYSSRVAPPDSTSRHLVEVGCLPEKPINAWKERILKKELMRETITEDIPFIQLHHPIYINQSYFASIVMICSSTALTNGLEDLFLKIVRRTIQLCEALWKRHIQTSFPFYFFFTRLMSGEDMSKDYIQVQAALAKIPERAEFKLIALETRELSRAQQTERLMTTTAHLNGGNCCCFPCKDNFYSLYYAPPSDSDLSHTKTLQQLDALVYQAYGIQCGVSQVFEHLEDLNLAYRQTQIALAMKETIKGELLMAGSTQDKGVFLFEETLLSYLVSQQEHDERLVKFTFSHTIVEKLYAEDKLNNTNYLALFWFYLHHERNASVVAQRLHMHRNTVLYHVEKIQKRFDFDLSIQSALERMRIDFKSFFLQSSKETFEDVFADAKVRSFDD